MDKLFCVFIAALLVFSLVSAEQSICFRDENDDESQLSAALGSNISLNASLSSDYSFECESVSDLSPQKEDSNQRETQTQDKKIIVQGAEYLMSKVDKLISWLLNPDTSRVFPVYIKSQIHSEFLFEQCPANHRFNTLCFEYILSKPVRYLILHT